MLVLGFNTAFHTEMYAVYNDVRLELRLYQKFNNIDPTKHPNTEEPGLVYGSVLELD